MRTLVPILLSLCKHLIITLLCDEEVAIDTLLSKRIEVLFGCYVVILLLYLIKHENLNPGYARLDIFMSPSNKEIISEYCRMKPNLDCIYTCICTCNYMYNYKCNCRCNYTEKVFFSCIYTCNYSCMHRGWAK